MSLSYTGTYDDEWVAREEYAARRDLQFPDMSRFSEPPWYCGACGADAAIETTHDGPICGPCKEWKRWLAL